VISSIVSTYVVSIETNESAADDQTVSVTITVSTVEKTLTEVGTSVLYVTTTYDSILESQAV
jgi:hypothetical protein